VTIKIKDFVPRRDDDDDEIEPDDDGNVEGDRDGGDGGEDNDGTTGPGSRSRLPENISDRQELPDIDKILAEYADTARYVLLDRWESQAWTFLDRLEYPDAGLVNVKNRFGGGKYRMRIMDENAYRKKQVMFRISGRSKDGDEGSTIPAPANDDKETIRELRARLDAVEHKNGGGDTGGISSNKLMDAIVMRLLEPPKADPLVGKLLDAVVGRESNDNGVDAVELQKLLNSARAEGYQQGKALGEALATAVGEGDPIARVLATTLPSVIDAFNHAQETYKNARPNPPVRQAAARVTEQVATPLPKTTEETPVSFANGPGWVNALRPAVPMLLKWARDGKDAPVKAANTVDDLNDDIREAIAIQAESPDFIESVLNAIPEFQAEDVRPWIISFLFTIQSILTEAEDGAVSLPGENAEIAEA
jgi:hypothetical protein